MKTLLKTIVTAITLFCIMAFASINANKETHIATTLEPSHIASIIDPEIVKPELPKNQTGLFLNKLGHKESGNRYDVVNSYGYMGRYQFGKSTLEGLGYYISREDFLNSPAIQEKAILDLLRHNRRILKSYIIKYNDSVVNNVYITESGLLAAAHIAGPGNVKKFFEQGRDFKDGYGTYMTTYMSYFAGYELDI